MRRFLLITASAVALTIGAGLDAAHAWNQSTQHGTISHDQVTQAQRELQSQGFYQGEVDGIAGPQTRQAVKDFQRQNGLQVTGSLDQQTIDKLNGGSASGSNATTSSGSSGASSSSSGSGLGSRLGSMMPKQQPTEPAHGAWQGSPSNSPTTNSTTNSTGGAAPSATH